MRIDAINIFKLSGNLASLLAVYVSMIIQDDIMVTKTNSLLTNTKYFTRLNIKN
jgi:hypothetical protein